MVSLNNELLRIAADMENRLQSLQLEKATCVEALQVINSKIAELTAEKAKLRNILPAEIAGRVR